MSAKASKVKRGRPSSPTVHSPSKRAKWKPSQAHQDNGWSKKPLLDRLHTPTPPLIARMQGPTDSLHYNGHSPGDFQEEAENFLSQLSLKERIHGKLINRISSPIEHAVDTTESVSHGRPSVRLKRLKADDLMDVDHGNEVPKSEEVSVETVRENSATKKPTSDLDALKTTSVDRRTAVSEETRPKDISMDRSSPPGLNELQRASHHSQKQPSGRDEEVLSDDLVEILLDGEPEEDASPIHHQDMDEDSSAFHSSQSVAVLRHTTRPASSAPLRMSPIDIPSKTTPLYESSTTSTPSKHQYSIEQCRHILVPIIHRNIESHRSAKPDIDLPDKEELVRRISEMLTDDQCIQFMQLSSQLKTEFAQIMDERLLYDFMNKIRGIKRPRDETEEEKEARKRRTTFADPAAILPSTTPNTGRDIYGSPVASSTSLNQSSTAPSSIEPKVLDSGVANADEIKQVQSTKINRNVIAETSNSGFSSSNAKDPHIGIRSNDGSIPPRSDSSRSSAFPVAPRTPVGDYDDIEEGELSPEIEYGLDSGVFPDPVAERNIDHSDEIPEEGEYMSEKRKGKMKATEEEYKEFILDSQDNSSDDHQQVGSEEGEVTDDRPEYEKGHNAPPESSLRSLEPDLSLRPGPVPGLWFVRHGDQSSDILETTFFIDDEVEEGIRRWCRRHQSSVSHRQISLNIQCLPRADVLEVGELLRENNASEEEVARVLWEMPCSWPSKGSLLIQVNHDHVGGTGRTWLPYEMIQKTPIDISSSVCSGLNSLRIIQLGDMSEYFFMLHASEHFPDISSNSLNWSRYEELFRSDKLTSPSI